MPKNATAADRWRVLDTNRSSHLERARICAKVTIPSLLPPEDHTPDEPLPTPFQSMGARCANHLASKLLLTMLPPNTPFFKFGLPARMVEEIKEESGEEAFKTEIQKKLRTIEQEIVEYIEEEGHRPSFFKLLRAAIVTGNTLIEMPKAGGVKCHRLDNYVVRRNPAGEPIEIILREYLDADDPVVQKVSKEKPSMRNQSSDGGKIKKNHQLFTWLRYQPDREMWTMTQELHGERVMGGTFKPKDMPFYPLALNLVTGEDYGRGPVEEYLGDFTSLEGLMKAIVQGAAAAARIIFLVRPGGVTSWKKLTEASNLGAIAGREEDVNVLQIQKLSDFSIAYQMVDQLRDRLSKAFLLHDSVQRHAERVTAVEIQFMAQELEDALGGIYTTLSNELQLPYLQKVIRQMKQRNRFSKDLPDVLKLTITSGFAALGRGHELQKLDVLMQRLQAFLGSEGIMQLLGPTKLGVLIAKYSTAIGIDTEGWIPSKEEFEAREAEQAQAAQMEQLMANPQVQQIMAQMGGGGQ